MFSKSKTKRFQEPTVDGPAVGQYDVKDINAKSKAVSFIKDKRWKKGEEKNGVSGYGSLENLGNGGLSFGHKPLVPLAQSTCMSKKNRRKSCFPVSNSATDLRSCRRLNLSRSLEDNIGYPIDEVASLQEKIIKLEAEIEALKSLSEKTKVSNDELQISLNEILNEKLATELENQKLIRNLNSMKEEELRKTEKMVKCLSRIELSFPAMINKTTLSFSNFERMFEGKQEDYLTRLDGANSLLSNIKMKNDNTDKEFQNLENKYTTLQYDYEMLIAERCIKEHLIAEQEAQLTEFENKVMSLLDELKSKDEVCSELTVQLDDTVREKMRTETVFSEEKNDILKRIEGLESIHENELKEINSKLLSSQNLNLEYRKQIENVELSMTENIREMSKKYECLEETFDKAQKGYQRSLERSNLLVQKMTLANKVNREEFENLQNMYTTLQHDYGQLYVDCETKDDMILEKDMKIQSHENNITELEDQLNSIEQSNEDACNTLKKQIDDLNENMRERDERIHHHEDNIDLLKDQLKSVGSAKEESCSRLNKQIDHLSQEVIEKDNTICAHEKSINILKDQLDTIGRTHQDACDVLNKQIEDLHQEMKNKQIVYEEEKEDLVRELSDMKTSMEASSTAISQEDMDQLLLQLSEAQNSGEGWKLKYEELQRKVGPFMDQLEQYEFEKQSLLNQNLLSQQEMKKLSEKYGQILGHQNNKQKIRHISKLKEENLQLKADVVKLRSNADKDRIKLSQLESKAHGKRFDPAKSFSHGKENRDALKTMNS